MVVPQDSMEVTTQVVHIQGNLPNFGFITGLVCFLLFNFLQWFGCQEFKLLRIIPFQEIHHVMTCFSTLILPFDGIILKQCIDIILDVFYISRRPLVVKFLRSIIQVVFPRCRPTPILEYTRLWILYGVVFFIFVLLQRGTPHLFTPLLHD